jgi:type I restriction enzyme R subunit/putative DNA methylase
MDPPDHKTSSLDKRHGAYLPHWNADGAAYFVTFRLGDALPQPVVDAYRRERDHLLAAYEDHLGHPASESLLFTQGDLQRLRTLFSENIERYLDSGMGACWMNQLEIAELVQNALLYFHARRYDLHAWAIMPNHVHAVLRPLPGHELAGILHSWKSFTAKEANRFLGRTGTFWQAESYDHLVRNAADLQHCIEYTLKNPVVAGLTGWRWVGTPSEHRRDADAT